MGEIAFYVLACAARGTIRLFRVSISLFILREFLWLEDKRERERIDVPSAVGLSKRAFHRSSRLAGFSSGGCSECIHKSF